MYIGLTGGSKCALTSAATNCLELRCSFANLSLGVVQDLYSLACRNHLILALRRSTHVSKTKLIHIDAVSVFKSPIFVTFLFSEVRVLVQAKQL